MFHDLPISWVLSCLYYGCHTNLLFALNLSLTLRSDHMAKIMCNPDRVVCLHQCLLLGFGWKKVTHIYLNTYQNDIFNMRRNTYYFCILFEKALPGRHYHEKITLRNAIGTPQLTHLPSPSVCQLIEPCFDFYNVSWFLFSIFDFLLLPLMEA